MSSASDKTFSIYKHQIQLFILTPSPPYSFLPPSSFSNLYPSLLRMLLRMITLHFLSFCIFQQKIITFFFFRETCRAIITPSTPTNAPRNAVCSSTRGPFPSPPSNPSQNPPGAQGSLIPP